MFANLAARSNPTGWRRMVSEAVIREASVMRGFGRVAEAGIKTTNDVVALVVGHLKGDTGHRFVTQKYGRGVANSVIILVPSAASLVVVLGNACRLEVNFVVLWASLTVLQSGDIVGCRLSLEGHS
jgi:hypothetical protein